MMSRTGNNRGFTLFEVMIATVILSLGTLLISETFLVFFDAISLIPNYLEGQLLLNEKIWGAQENLLRNGSVNPQDTSGVIKGYSKEFSWNLSVSPADEGNELFKINAAISFKMGKRDRHIKDGVCHKIKRRPLH